MPAVVVLVALAAVWALVGGGGVLVLGEAERDTAIQGLSTPSGTLREALTGEASRMHRGDVNL